MSNVTIDAPTEPLIDAGTDGARCHWFYSVCPLPPTRYLTWNDEAELYCQRHYVLRLDHITTVHPLVCDIPLDEHIGPRGSL